MKIVSDSSANLYTLEGVDFASVDMIVSTDDKEYRDNYELDVETMVGELLRYKGRSGTACPGVGEWLEAFGEAKEIICTTITGKLSGSYNAAMTAKAQYEEEHPGRRVFVVDTLSAGPGMKMMLSKARELMQAGMDYDTVCQRIIDYKAHVMVAFSLESVKNLANNGRIHPALATVIGALGIRIVGNAEGGVLNPTDKIRTERKALAAAVTNMVKDGYQGGRVMIDHCLNEKGAALLRQLLLEKFPKAEIIIGKTNGLCSFYAEKGGLMIGYER